MNDDIWKTAARIKVNTPAALPDCFCAALARKLQCAAVTADRTEFVMPATVRSTSLGSEVLLRYTEPRADLHIHTTASDGALAPARVVEIARDLGLAAIAITDHDTVDGIEEALDAGRELGLEVITGIEISAVHGERTEAHILGYFIDHRDPDLLKSLSILHDARWDRGMQMVEKLNAAGVPVSFERVVEIAGGGAIGRPHVARAICETGAASSMDSAFGRFLQEKGPAFVPRYKVTPSEAVRMIREAGGVACCAHAAKLKRDDLIKELIANGLAAIEVYHPDHSTAGSRFYKRFAESRGLIATGGSDAHFFEGDIHGGIGCVTVGYDIVEQLRTAAGLANR